MIAALPIIAMIAALCAAVLDTASGTLQLRRPNIKAAAIARNQRPAVAGVVDTTPP
jgi:hypothetical protein